MKKMSILLDTEVAPVHGGDNLFVVKSDFEVSQKIEKRREILAIQRGFLEFLVAVVFGAKRNAP